jgi:acyl transferase domain-containing protein/3-hydroxymyristoyl/3-hydroxydecanoyl-(acyl carrier protein) dehydratase
VIARQRPLAIVGRACALPEAPRPSALWQVVDAKRDVITDVPAGRFRIDPALVAGKPGDCVDRTYSTRGGYVRDVDAVDVDGLDLDFFGGAGAMGALDPLFHWVLRAGRDCLEDAGFAGGRDVRASAVLGNLSFPTEAMTLLGEQQLLDALDEDALGPRSLRKRIGGPWARDVDVRNRFMSGLPAQLLARALRLSGGAFALDAACASSLYALRLAACALDDGRADVVLAGAVNRADSLFLHVGFCALQALSSTGTPRPFDRKADGLVPAEGCAFVALMRLEDAIAQGKRIHGVVRGVGLSNDGRGKNLLAPSSEGQVRAIRAAWDAAGLATSTCDYLECHATGTPMGDRTEVMSVAEAFATSQRASSSRPLPLGSLKGNLGHLITAAGVAGLIKVTEAFAHETLPASIHADEPLDVLDGRLGVVVQQEGAPWPKADDRPRRAGVSAFGFGGNNAHVVVDEPPRTRTSIAVSATDASPARVPTGLAVVALGVRLGPARDLAGLVRLLDAHDAHGAQHPTPDESEGLDVVVDGVKFPPNDLSASIAQQLLVFEVARDAVRDVDELFKSADARARTGVFIGMGTDVRITSPGLRWRAPAIAARLDVDDDASFIAALRDAAIDPLGAQHILGCMPNIPANRINVQLDVRGPGFTVSAEEHSGLVALDIAHDLIVRGELDTAVVGAVDVGSDLRARLAAHRDGRVREDGAIVFVVVDEARARRDQLPIIAVIDANPGARQADGVALNAPVLAPHIHAASGLFAVTEAIARGLASKKPDGTPWLAHKERALVATAPASWTSARSLSVVVPVDHAAVRGLGPAVFACARPDRASLVDALARGDGLSPGAGGEAGGGEWRAAVVAATREELAVKRAQLAGLVASGVERVDDDAGGLWFRREKRRTADEVCLTFGTAGLVAPGTGFDLARAFPAVVSSLNIEASALAAVLGGTRHPRGCLGDLAMATAAMQLAARAIVDVIGVRANHALGVSLGESNALFASGAWPDLGRMLDDMERSRLFDDVLAGNFASARAYWESAGRPDLARDPWRAVSVRAPIERIRAACEADDVRGFCFVLVVHTDDEAELGGAPFAVDRVVRALGVAAAPMPQMPSVHCPLLDPAAAAYRELHHREVVKVAARLHSHGAEAPLRLTSDDVADAILAQARRTVDVPARVRAVVAGGVRVLVDASPRGLTASWIKRIDPTLDVVAVDGTVASLASAAAELFVAGVDVDFAKLHAVSPRPVPARTMHVDTARPLRPLPRALRVDTMTAAPRLPRITPERPGGLDGGATLGASRRGAANDAPTTATAASAHAPTDEHDMNHARDIAGATEPGDNEGAHEPGADVVHANREAALQAHRGLLDAMAAGHRAFLAHREAHLARLLQFDDRETIAAELLPPVLWDRRDLEVLASGRIADVWGEQFAVQDGFRRQVRMPEPPLLLADRVVSIDATPGVLEKNRTIVTETDLTKDLWYLHENRCPAGVLIETGQADLLLISYMGVDFENRGERVYRLLGCDLTYRAPLPLAGSTLRHDIHIDGFAQSPSRAGGDTRIFFFHSDTSEVAEVSKPVLTVREGQAGFFTDEELASSGGILWKPTDVASSSLLELPLATPPCVTKKRALSQHDLAAFADGRAFDCFGQGFELAQTHVRSPRVPGGDLLLIDRVTNLDVGAGGPWNRGYLRAEYDLSPERWFFDGHFKDDPCMPGTIMFEGCLETLAIYLAACGFTLDRDGHRFEPAVDKTFRLRCRGQATPSSRKLVYEVFVKSLIDGREPAVVADILVTIDGLKGLHCADVELKLAVDWPLSREPAFTTHDGVAPSTTHALLATGIGKPSDAFPGLYERFDQGERVPRLPGPPYHFMTRVVEVGGPAPGALVRNENAAGTFAVVEYDVPADAWYFDQGLSASTDAMPFAVLLEVALQPCGWVSSIVGSALTSTAELFYRNLDGTAHIHREVERDIGTLRTTATLRKSSSSGGMIIQEHEVRVTTSSGEPVFDCVTVFGFFPKDALARQVGISTTDVERARLAERCAGFTPVDVDDAFVAPKLRMIDRVTGWWPSSSSPLLGRVRAEKKVDASEWFFQAHFFQDPVQPGSLGLEAIAQAIAWVALREKPGSRVESLCADSNLVWKYRGQVLPTNKLVQVEAEIVDVTDGVLRANGSLWVDGTRIYLAEGLAIRLVDEHPGSALRSSRSK